MLLPTIENGCNHINVGAEMGLGLELCAGCECRKHLKVMKSAAGWYIGASDDEGPFCRATRYMSEEEARNVSL